MNVWEACSLIRSAGLAAINAGIGLLGLAAVILAAAFLVACCRCKRD